jgi:hypothetical protein
MLHAVQVRLVSGKHRLAERDRKLGQRLVLPGPSRNHQKVASDQHLLEAIAGNVAQESTAVSQTQAMGPCFEFAAKRSITSKQELYCGAVAADCLRGIQQEIGPRRMSQGSREEDDRDRSIEAEALLAFTRVWERAVRRALHVGDHGHPIGRHSVAPDQHPSRGFPGHHHEGGCLGTLALPGEDRARS